ncbi:hypothetical protein MSG28_005777 [Choristoneura fumiferana]|uniref:Uncharacterized protein n=1 Tax=Choristoneura fumiferana TaxID=7141 RepID=A0ACC0L196_CHOFU|nr:hypothetical protein MSG28_005777 [Choristoneura fumiferana]
MDAPPLGANITVGGTPIAVGSTMKYLGLVLDGRWKFEEHFRRLAPKLVAAAGALGRILPNVGGPGGSCRRLYTGVVRSVALYGAPIWAENLSARNVTLLRRSQRAMALRVAYRTVSYTAACLLAGSPPWDLEAEVNSNVCWRISAARAEEIWPHPPIRPVLKEWVERKHDPPTYHVTQLLTGHGCFKKYMCGVVGREPSTMCHHCDGRTVDTAEHTRTECPAWAEPRAVLSTVIGDLSLPALIEKIAESEEAWAAFCVFADDIMSQTEAAKREHEDDVNSLPQRRRRPGWRWSQPSDPPRGVAPLTPSLQWWTLGSPPQKARDGGRGGRLALPAWRVFEVGRLTATAAGRVAEDDDDEEVLERKVAELEKRIAEDPYSYDDHIQLIQALWGLSELDRWRNAFDRLQQMSMLKAEHWLLRIQTEETLAHSAEAKEQLVELFRQASLDCY